MQILLFSVPTNEAETFRQRDLKLSLNILVPNMHPRHDKDWKVWRKNFENWLRNKKSNWQLAFNASKLFRATQEWNRKPEISAFMAK